MGGAAHKCGEEGIWSARQKLLNVRVAIGLVMNNAIAQLPEECYSPAANSFGAVSAMLDAAHLYLEPLERNPVVDDWVYGESNPDNLYSVAVEELQSFIGDLDDLGILPGNPTKLVLAGAETALREAAGKITKLCSSSPAATRGTSSVLRL